MSDIKSIKQRFGIIGVSPLLDRALEKAVQVAPTDISVLVTGESGVGKESIPKIIHALSHRKHNPYIAVNCGAIPEGTIDSELFGHEKGAFTGATGARKGYFEEADGGTIFLDEVAGGVFSGIKNKRTSKAKRYQLSVTKTQLGTEVSVQFSSDELADIEASNAILNEINDNLSQ